MFGCENSNGRRNFQRAATCCDLQHRNSSNMTGCVRKVRCWLPIDRPHWEVMNITPDFFHHLKPWFGQDYLTAYGTMPSSIKEWIHRVTWTYFLNGRFEMEGETLGSYIFGWFKEPTKITIFLYHAQHQCFDDLIFRYPLKSYNVGHPVFFSKLLRWWVYSSNVTMV